MNWGASLGASNQASPWKDGKILSLGADQSGAISLPRSWFHHRMRPADSFGCLTAAPVAWPIGNFLGNSQVTHPYDLLFSRAASLPCRPGSSQNTSIDRRRKCPSPRTYRTLNFSGSSTFDSSLPRYGKSEIGICAGCGHVFSLILSRYMAWSNTAPCRQPPSGWSCENRHYKTGISVLFSYETLSDGASIMGRIHGKNKAGGKVMRGLIRRREAERALYLRKP